MAQVTTMAQAAVAVAGDEAEARCSLTCECWDCRAYRRHLAKLAAMVLLACGLGGEVGWQRGLWRANPTAPAAEVELASAASPGEPSWY